jgi:hypothetical protein
MAWRQSAARLSIGLPQAGSVLPGFVAVLRRGAGRTVGEGELSQSRSRPTAISTHLAADEDGDFQGPFSPTSLAHSLPARSPPSSAAPNRVAFVRALDGQITLGVRGGSIQLGAPIDLP